MPAEHYGSDDPSVHGGRGVRQTVPPEEAHADFAVQPARRDLPAGRTVVSDVPGGRHEEEPHHRGAREGAAHQEEGQWTTLNSVL